MMLGRLERIELREIWGNEATDFTPWLAQEENLAALSETLGMDLESAGIEQSVGIYRADILCKDSFTGNFVLIENQLERTNHSHLGQILTYSAGLNAKTIIWIASRFTDEHRAALDYLNEITAEDYSFFGLEIELWRIENSAAAPKFNIVSRPNDWAKNVRETTHNTELSETKREQLAYWTAFKTFMEDRRSKVRCQNPSAVHWTNMSIGRGGFWLNAKVNSLKSRISVALNMKTPQSKSVYHYFADKKDEIEVEFGTALEWAELPGKNTSIISLSLEGADFRVREDWDTQFEWLATNLERFDSTFRTRIKALN